MLVASSPAWKAMFSATKHKHMLTTNNKIAIENNVKSKTNIEMCK